MSFSFFTYMSFYMHSFYFVIVMHLKDAYKLHDFRNVTKIIFDTQ